VRPRLIANESRDADVRVSLLRGALEPGRSAPARRHLTASRDAGGMGRVRLLELACRVGTPRRGRRQQTCELPPQGCGVPIFASRRRCAAQFPEPGSRDDQPLSYSELSVRRRGDPSRGRIGRLQEDCVCAPHAHVLHPVTPGSYAGGSPLVSRRARRPYQPNTYDSSSAFPAIGHLRPDPPPAPAFARDARPCECEPLDVRAPFQ
jgi:hypothetical protein